ncbi:MAG: hypothetical protein LUD02_07945 [Tannerellaceae bacterium]|nr:hypothetical protein [Tannerellaceae bacterium]MCD8264088.1 hypothetical protein [Tannerellaceae bacterium]
MNLTIRTILFNLSGILLLAGAILYLTKLALAPYLFAVGAAGLTVFYLTYPVGNLDFRHKRLHRMNVLAGGLMVAASALMFRGRNEWILCLTISAILQVYTSFVWKQKTGG